MAVGVPAAGDKERRVGESGRGRDRVRRHRGSEEAAAVEAVAAVDVAQAEAREGAPGVASDGLVAPPDPAFPLGGGAKTREREEGSGAGVVGSRGTAARTLRFEICRDQGSKTNKPLPPLPSPVPKC